MNSCFDIFRRTLLVFALILGIAARAADAPAADPTAPVAPVAPDPVAPPTPAPPAPPPEPVAPAPPVDVAAPAPGEPEVAVEAATDQEKASPPARRSRERRSSNPVVGIGADAHLPAGDYADAVVAIIGSATAEGEVSDAIVSIAGETRATGPVGDAAVAILGNVYVNNRVGGDVVAVLGNVELGPEARVHGEVVAVGGRVTRHARAEVDGGVNMVPALPFIPDLHFEGLREWFRRALLMGRPLAIGPDLGWAWAIATGFLAFYIVLALLFRGGMDRCVDTLETRPGSSVVAAILAMLLSPVLLVLLLVTVVGMVLVPFFAVALLAASLFGKAVMLAWLGRRVVRGLGAGPSTHVAVAVLVGGILVLGLYLVPVFGFILYKLLGLVGLGAVVNTIIIGSRRERAVGAAAPRGPSASVPVAAAVGTSIPTNEPARFTAVAAEQGAAAAPGVVSAGFPGADPAGVPPMTGVTLPPPPVPTSTLPRAGFWIRMGALALDIIIVALIIACINFALPRQLEFEMDPFSLMPWLAIYGALMWRMKSTTIGGVVCGLKVVRLDGREMDSSTAVVRALSCFLSIAVVGLGFIWVVIDEDRQSWHDKIAGTVVVRMPRGMALI